jgi:hypothetical protein
MWTWAFHNPVALQVAGTTIKGATETAKVIAADLSAGQVRVVLAASSSALGKA